VSTRLRLIATAGLLCTACSLASLLPPPRFDDEDYRFSLRPPNRAWRVLDEREVQRLVPDAAAGLINERDRMVAVVIIEQAPSNELEPLARAIVDNAPLEKKSITHFDAVSYQGRAAIRYLMTGEVNGVGYRYGNTLFVHQEHLYQLITWGSIDQTEADGASFEKVWRAFSILDGPVRGRQVQTNAEDARGVGWRTRDGEFESAVYGLRLRPAQGWRVAVGAELDGLNDSAEVALLRRAPQLTLLLIPERVSADDLEVIEGNLLSQTAASMGPRCPERDLRLRAAGQEIALRCFAGPEEEPFTYFHGLLYHDDFAIQLLGWLPSNRAAEAAPLLAEALGALELIDASARAQLAAALEAEADPQNQVGVDYSLRRGVYRDFTHGLTWTKPAGAWRLRVGDEARATDEAARFTLEHPASGVWGMLLTTPAFEASPEVYHRAVRAQLSSGAGEVTPRAVALGADTALVSEVESTQGAVSFVYRVATVVRDARAYQLLLWGTPANARDAAAELDAAVGGLSFMETGLAPVTSTAARYQDHRLGWSLALPDKPWVFSDLTDARVRPLGTTVQWRHEDVSVIVSAFCSVQEGQDASWYMDLLSRTYADQLGGARLGTAERGEAMLGGAPALHLRWRGRDGLDAFVVSRDQTIYALIIAQDDLILDWPLEEITRGFGYID